MILLFCSYIDHGNGLLCLRIYNAINSNEGVYSCHIYAAENTESVCFTSTKLQVVPKERNNKYEISFLKTPLPVIADIDETVTFCARVYPTNAPTKWFLCGHEIDQNDSDQFSVSILILLIS